MTASITFGGGTSPTLVFLGSDDFGAFSFTTDANATSDSGGAAEILFTRGGDTKTLLPQFAPLNPAAFAAVASGANAPAGGIQNSFSFAFSNLANSTTYEFAYRII